MKNNLLLIVVSVFLIYSCTSLEDEAEALVKKEPLNIPIDAKISPRTVTLKSANFGNKDLLYYVNNVNHEVIVFDLDEKKIKNRIHLKKEGPDAIKFLGGLTVLSESTIMIADGPPRLHIVNLEGEIIKRLDYTTDDGKINFAHYAKTISVLHNDIYQIDDRFIIPQQPTFQNQEGKALIRNDKLKTKLFIEINKDGTGTRFLDITIPDDFFENIPVSGIGSFSSLMAEGKLIWSFNTDLSIYYSEDLVNVYRKEITAAKKRPPQKFNAKNLSPFETQARLDEYKSLLYDPYRKQYYRMVRYGVLGDERKGLPAEHLARYPNRFSIFVFDETFNLKKELKFSGTKYHFNQFFISSKGFYLSIANPLNPDFDENYLQFEKIEL